MLLAGVAAILVARARREKAAEDAVLGVKDGQMLVGNHLDQLRPQLTGQSLDLGGIQIVGGGDACQPKLKKGIAGERVGGIQAEITDQRRMSFSLQLVQQTS